MGQKKNQLFSSSNPTLPSNTPSTPTFLTIITSTVHSNVRCCPQAQLNASLPSLANIAKSIWPDVPPPNYFSKPKTYSLTFLMTVTGTTHVFFLCGLSSREEMSSRLPGGSCRSWSCRVRPCSCLSGAPHCSHCNQHSGHLIVSQFLFQF